jgi:hypothetical protein
MNLRCEVCDLAFEMGMSENQFYRKFGYYERAQLLATYRSKSRRAGVIETDRRRRARRRGK